MVYLRAACQQNSAEPSAPHAMPYLALLRHPNGPASPSAPGNAFSSGTNTSSMMISPVLEARRLNLPWIGGAESPFIPFSSRYPRIVPLSSFAHTTKTSAIGEFVIHVFAPLSLKPPLTVRAREIMLPGSEP